MELCEQCNKKPAVKRFCSLECYWKSLRGKPTWNKQKRIVKKCLNCGKGIIVRKGLKDKVKFCSRRCYSEWSTGKEGKKRNGKVLTECQVCKKQFFRWRYDINRKYCSRKCLGLANKKRLEGKNNWNWKGGVSSSRANTAEYKEWKKAVFERDNYTCQVCGKRGCYLEPHHIKSWANYPNLRFVVSNGKTLCLDCHSKTDNFRGKGNKKDNKRF